MKNLIIILSLVMMIGLVSAVPQVIFSDINISISSSQIGNYTQGNYRILGEGLDAATTFVVAGNCNFSYTRGNIPMTFSREVTQNETDIATLIHSLAINNNITQQWQDCVTNLSICNNDVGYKGNYTQTKNELDICYRARDDYSKQVTDKNAELDKLTSWRNIGVMSGIIGAGLAIYFYRKQAVKKINDPYNSVSKVAKQY